MTLDLSKLRAETLALLDGTTPGPWDMRVIDADFGEAQIGTGPFCEDDKSFDDWSVAKTHGGMDEAIPNARLIAAAPTLAADNLRLLDDNLRLLDEVERLNAENERLRGVLQDIVESWDWWTVDEYDRDRGGLADSIDAARAALAEGGPDDR